MDSRMLYASQGDADELDNRQERLASARSGGLVDARPPVPGRPDVVLELRVYVDPVDGGERWAVIAAFGDEETVIDFPNEAAARSEYEGTGESFGAAIYMGWETPR